MLTFGDAIGKYATQKASSYSASTKARVALEAIRERKTVAQFASQHRPGRPTSPTGSRWPCRDLAELFQSPGAANQDKVIDALYVVSARAPRIVGPRVCSSGRAVAGEAETG